MSLDPLLHGIYPVFLAEKQRTVGRIYPMGLTPLFTGFNFGSVVSLEDLHEQRSDQVCPASCGHLKDGLARGSYQHGTCADVLVDPGFLFLLRVEAREGIQRFALNALI